MRLDSENQNIEHFGEHDKYIVKLITHGCHCLGCPGFFSTFDSGHVVLSPGLALSDRRDWVTDHFEMELKIDH